MNVAITIMAISVILDIATIHNCLIAAGILVAVTGKVTTAGNYALPVCTKKNLAKSAKETAADIGKHANDRMVHT